MRGIRWMACGPLKALSNLRKLKKHMLQDFIDIDNDGGVQQREQRESTTRGAREQS